VSATLACEFHRDLEKPGHCNLIERWTGLAALRRPTENEYNKQIQAVFAELRTTLRTTDIGDPVNGKE
jgi:quinol monooxygenase YgiN